MSSPTIPVSQITGFERTGELAEPRKLTFDQSVDQAVKLDNNLFADTLREIQSLDAAPPMQGKGVGALLNDSVMEAARLGHATGQLKHDFSLGRTDDIHGILITARKAGISNKLVSAVRSKLLEAFQELWRINV